ncbi:hypothetical protein H7H73_19855 [Mycobacterium rufum]|uniref:Clp R domain-containing protein n=1 Tax=Mycolicibacterium rufum TaxID=318424 RepID=A0A9X3BIQ2_9MYCO|nr:hypothetical protein [Mycolicibacterium rufum]
MFERYTEEARELIGHAQLEARHLGHNMLGPEHLLLGALRCDGPVAAVLAESGLSHHRAVETLRHFRGAEVPPPEGHVPFSDPGRPRWPTRWPSPTGGATGTSAPNTSCWR